MQEAVGFSTGLDGSVSDVQMYSIPDRKGRAFFGYTFHFPKSNAEIRFMAPARTPNMVYAFEFGKVGSAMVGQVDLDSEAEKILAWAVNTKYRECEESNRFRGKGFRKGSKKELK